jgi:protein-S-isoprenylcysteine O-methyltransferase Ste14
MKIFLMVVLLGVGFSFNILSTYTALFYRKFGDKKGPILSILFRDVLGIPVWAAGFCLAAIIPSSDLLPRTLLVSVVGWISVAIGGAVIVAALVTIRRRSLAPTTKDALAESGLYARVRHPIHSGTFLEFLGLFVIRPSVTIGLACALGVIWVLIQTICEERDLLQRIPEYRDYMNRVPRFFPRIG